MPDRITLYLNSSEGPEAAGRELNALDAEGLGPHLDELREYLARFETPPLTLDQLGAVKLAMDLRLPEGLREEDRVWLMSVLEERGGFVFWEGQFFTVEALGWVVDLAELPEGVEDEQELQPPSAERVARRALALLVVIFRAFAEREEGLDLARLRSWAMAQGLDTELEPWEMSFLQAELGSPEPQDIVNATWRSEGLAVLAWALGAAELPPHDQLSHPGEIAATLGLMAETLPELITLPTLRPEAEREWLHGRLLGLHWRTVDFRVAPRTMDFAAFAKENWFGGFDLEGIPLVDDDLSVGGERIDQADPQAVGLTSSVALERHLAINWLMGWNPIYSEVDTST